MKHLRDTFQLNNGCEISCSSSDIWEMLNGDTSVVPLNETVEARYRYIDAATVYGNEINVGRSIKALGMNRKDLFVTSKVWGTERGYEKTMCAFEKTLSDLQLDYLDLYLIYWPASTSRFSDWEQNNLETWKAMIELYKSGRIKAIGVSNFLPCHLKSLVKTEVPPMVNQIEFHLGQMQDETVNFCRSHNIPVWSSFITGCMISSPQKVRKSSRKVVC